MSLFNDQYDNLLKAAQATFGHAGTVEFIPLAGSAFEISAIFEARFEAVDPDTMAVVVSKQPIIGIRVNEITDEISREPDKGDKVDIDGTEYKIIDYQPDGRGDAKLILQLV